MPYGLPDSWAGYGVKKLLNAAKGHSFSRGFSNAARGKSFTQYSYKFDKLILYKPVLHVYLNTQGGRLWKIIHFRGQIALMLAKQQVGKKTGNLALSIRMEHKTVKYGQELKIGSDNNIAYLHHEGTKPHIITPKDHPQLVFMSKGRIIRTQLVRHPGTRPNKYLSDQLVVFKDLGNIYTGKNIPQPKI